jgi:hypothetical protein
MLAQRCEWLYARAMIDAVDDTDAVLRALARAAITGDRFERRRGDIGTLEYAADHEGRVLSTPARVYRSSMTSSSSMHIMALRKCSRLHSSLGTSNRRERTI